MRKVLVFGTFDILHPGHIYFLKQAKLFGNNLIVVVARDLTVKKVKGEFPTNNENVRLRHLSELKFINKATLGNRDDKYDVIEEINPEAICLGYDQTSFTDKLEDELKKRKLNVKVVRLDSFEKDKYKSSKLKHNITQD